jgi:hypothetical protein
MDGSGQDRAPVIGGVAAGSCPRPRRACSVATTAIVAARSLTGAVSMRSCPDGSPSTVHTDPEARGLDSHEEVRR